MIDHHGYPFIRSLLQAKRIRKHERAKKNESNGNQSPSLLLPDSEPSFSDSVFGQF